MTDAELEGLGAQAFNMAKRDLERDRFNFLLAAYHESDVPPLHRMTKIENLIIERLGENWLNGGRAKDMGFYLLRKAVDMMPPDAVVVAFAGNQFYPTAKFKEELTPEQQRYLLKDAGHNKHHEAVAAGYMSVRDALVATVQTPERVCMYIQPFQRGRPVDKPHADFFPQEGFDGRLKMFGKGKRDFSGS